MHGRSGDRQADRANDNRYPVPDGFRQLLEALAREVLRGQPADIYAFSALFFRVLLHMRNEHNGENPILKPELYDSFKFRLFTEAVQEGLVSSALLSALTASKGAKKTKHVSKTEDVDIDLNDPQVQKAATKIQASYKGFTVRKQLGKSTTSGQEVNEQRHQHHHRYEDPNERDRAATKIQANMKGYLTRKKYKAGELKPAPRGPAKRPAPKRPKTLEDQAAVKIQAGVKGYLTRKKLASDGIPVKSPTSQSSRSPMSGGSSSLKSPSYDPDTAAVKIQAGIRGYLTRKQLEAKGVPVRSPTHHSHARSHQKLDNDPNADVAASKIQAGVRGYLTRKHLDKEGVLRKSPARNANTRLETRRVTIANVDEAASKIQAGVRGYLTRKKLEAQGIRVRSGGVSPASTASPTGPHPGGAGVAHHHNHIGDDGIGSPGEAEEAAATRIQAAFRGHMVRQQYAPGKVDENEDGDFV